MVWSGLRLWIHGVLSMIRVTVGLPPDHATSGRTNIASRSGSLVRADRIGPSSVTSWECTTAMYRLMPSTFSSMTTSARSRPICGIASGALSILATSAGRSRRSTAGERRRRPGRGRRGRRGGGRGVVRRGRLRRLVAPSGEREHDAADHDERERHPTGDQRLPSPPRRVAGRTGSVPAHRRHRVIVDGAIVHGVVAHSPIVHGVVARRIAVTSHCCSLAESGPRRPRVGCGDRRSA